MMLLSVEINTGKAALFGFPRNLVNVPLPAESKGAYAGGVFPEMLSALWRRAAEQPNKFPGSEGIGKECQFDWECERGWRAITGAIQELAGVPIDGLVAVDFYGFIALVDAVGGVWVDVPSRLVDERYPDPDGGRIRIDIKPGCQKFNGKEALAYARSRHQDSDYQRMRRQQTVLKAVRRQFDPIALIPRINDLLLAAKENLYTTFSQNDIQNLAHIASRVDADRLYQVRFTPRQVERIGGLSEIRTRVRNIFSEPEPTPTPTPSDRPARCPADGQT
jgi:polyisoprenyl-teichoic acid--peptidoglycan teichoic acid transferase